MIAIQFLENHFWALWWLVAMPLAFRGVALLYGTGKMIETAKTIESIKKGFR